MRKLVDIKNIGLILIVLIVSIFVLNTKEVKATGTITWNGPSSITIRETISNIANPLPNNSKSFYALLDNDPDHVWLNAHIIHSSSDTITNYQITKSTTMNLTSLAFSKPGDYVYHLDQANGINGVPNDTFLNESSNYKVTIQVRNEVDANNVPTGNFIATVLLKECENDSQTQEETECTKIDAVGGNLIADFSFVANSDNFGHIELSKTVKGTGADTTKYFPFTVNIDSANRSGDAFDISGYTFPISGIDASITYNGSTINNPTSITVGTPVTIYLKHGQTAIFGQVTSGGSTFDTIPKNNVNINGCSSSREHPSWCSNRITISETQGDYTTRYSTGDGWTTGTTIDSLPIYDSSTNMISFENTKESSIVTGIFTIVIPYILLIGIGIGGTLAFISCKKNKQIGKSS